MDSWRSPVPVMGHVGDVGFAVERQNKAQPRLGQINACLALADSVDSGVPWNPSRHNEKTLCSKAVHRCAGGPAAVVPWRCHGRLVTALVPRGRSRFMSGDAKGNTARSLCRDSDLGCCACHASTRGGFVGFGTSLVFTTNAWVWLHEFGNW